MFDFQHDVSYWCCVVTTALKYPVLSHRKVGQQLRLMSRALVAGS